MLSWLRKGKDDKTELEIENSSQGSQHDPITEEEQSVVAKVTKDFMDAKATREGECDETGFSIEENWEDEYFIYKGGGLQWLTNFAYRTKKDRRIRPNSEDNFVFNALTIQHANVTSDTPQISIFGVEDDDEEVAKKLTFASRMNDNRNKFTETWKKWVYDFIGSGPTIAMVTWDSEWMGGKGPERFAGDVRVKRIDKWDMYFDPAITNLEENMQDCSYIVRRVRKKLKYIRDRWDKGKLVGEQHNEDDLIYEGGNPEQAYVIEYWHRGFPWMMEDYKVKELREKAIRLEEEGDYYKAKDYYEAAKGNLFGIHVAYVSDGVLLEYCSYEYEHGQYPFVFTSRYFDEKNQWGFGEIRNIKIPQIMHNKADEIEIEAMTREGLGGYIYQTGAINDKQITKMLENSGRAGMLFPVDNINMIKERTGVKVPGNVTNYKEHKQRMIETISSNTPINQGQMPTSNTPGIVIQELGARSDVRMKQISNKLEDFIVNINNLRIELFGQFYTEERYYRIRGSNGKMEQGTIKADDIKREWSRDIEIEQTEDGIAMPIERKEKFIPEFDVKAVVISEKPTDRNYYTNLALQLYQMQLLTKEDFLSTLEEGKLPSMADILEHLEVQQQKLMQQQMMMQQQQIPPMQGY